MSQVSRMKRPNPKYRPTFVSIDQAMVIPDDRDHPDVALDTHHAVQRLHELLDLLPKRTAWVLRMRYGIGADREGVARCEHSLRDIGERIALGPETTRQIERRGMVQLQVWFGMDHEAISAANRLRLGKHRVGAGR